MSFVGEDNVFDGDVVLLHGGDEFVAFDLQHARIVLALDDEQRLHDVGGVEQRRDTRVAFGVGGRVAHLVKERLFLGAPPCGDFLQRARPVGDAEDVDAGVEFFWAEGEGCGDHVAAVGPAHDGDLVFLHPVERLQVLLAMDDVVEIDFAVLLVVHVEEGLAVARRAAVVHAQDGVAVVGEVLVHRRITLAVLTAGSAVNVHDSGDGVLGARAFRLEQDGRDIEAVEALVANDFSFNEHLLVDRRVEVLRQARGGACGEVCHEHVGGRGVGRNGEGDLRFVVVETHRADIAGRNAGEGDRLVGGLVVDGDFGRGVSVDGVDAILAGRRVGDEHHVPVGLEQFGFLAGGEIVGPGLREFAVLVGSVDQRFGVGREFVDAIGHDAVVRRDEDGLLRGGLGQVCQIDVRVSAGVLLGQRQPFAIRRDRGREEAGVLEDEFAGERGRVIRVEIEHLRVALVGGEPEGLAVGGPADEFAGVLVAGREVFQRGVSVADIDVGQLVAAAIRRDEDAVIGGEVADREDCVGRGGGEGGEVAACDGQGGGVEHAGLVGCDQHIRAIGREGKGRRRRHRHGGRVEEGLGVVSLMGRRLGFFLNGRLAGCQRDRRQSADDSDITHMTLHERAHDGRGRLALQGMRDEVGVSRRWLSWQRRW